MSWGRPCEEQNLTTVRLFGRPKTWHRAGVGHVKYAELLALRTRYGAELLGLAKTSRGPYVVQTYACREVRGGDVLSNHAWPRALDVKPWANPMREDGVLQCDYRRHGLVDGLRFVGAFLAAGFSWGATWSGERPLARWALLRVGKRIRSARVDPMHFEREAPPRSDRRYWVRRLRRYALRHPMYLRRVKREADVRTLRALVDAWWEGKA